MQGKPRALGWGLVLGLVLLLILAVASIGLARGAILGQDEYLNEDSPAAVVHDAFIAAQRGDQERLESFFSQEALTKEGEQIPRPPLREFSDYGRRLQVHKVRIRENRAWVDITIHNFRARAPFGRSEWSSNFTVELRREEGRWKIVTPPFFLF
ncbi:MAG TPA: nuclear transport factor 2 family protein [Anaerolineae bacterium]|nr:nuclear transport factor 2 family protein [Anaerolineae bacterium]HIQ05212.1 nuclear transport factor 2 family protein [Anaerolineae bacterium]